MTANVDSPGALYIHTLSDALGIGLDLLDLFAADGDCCAVWLGDAAGALRDFVICTEDRGRDCDRLVRYAMLSATLLDDVTQAVLWRTADDLGDAPALALRFFDHRDELGSIGVDLVDEIALGDDELRSVAITSFVDPPGWDDVSAGLTCSPDSE